MDQKIRELLGAKDVQIAVLSVEIERLREELAALKDTQGETPEASPQESHVGRALRPRAAGAA